MPVGSLVVRTRPSMGDGVVRRLSHLPGATVVGREDNALAVVLEAGSAREQERCHKQIAAWPDVEEALVVFQALDGHEVDA